jgi:hypothetical protein
MPKLRIQMLDIAAGCARFGLQASQDFINAKWG